MVPHPVQKRSWATVLFVYSAHENPLTGGPQMLARFLRRIDRKRFRPILLAQCKDPIIEELQKKSSVEILLLETPKTFAVFGGKMLRAGPKAITRRFAALLVYTWRATKLIKNINPDLIWCINLRALLSIGLAARFNGRHVIWQIGLGVPSLGINLWVNKVALWLSTTIFIESKSQIIRIFNSKQRRAYSEKFMVLPKGIDLSRFDPAMYQSSLPILRGIESNAYIIGTVGSLTSRKGLHVLLESFVSLMPTERKLYLIVVGGNPDESNKYYRKLLNRIAEMNLKNHVYFAGTSDNVPAWMAAFDLFVLPSLSEGISGALREAMAMALPIVATDVGGTPDAIQNGFNGLLVPPGNSDKLAAAIKCILFNPQLAELFGKRARETALRLYSVNDHVARYQDAFDILLKKRMAT